MKPGMMQDEGDRKGLHLAVALIPLSLCSSTPKLDFYPAITHNDKKPSYFFIGYPGDSTFERLMF